MYFYESYFEWNSSEESKRNIMKKNDGREMRKHKKMRENRNAKTRKFLEQTTIYNNVSISERNINIHKKT